MTSLLPLLLPHPAALQDCPGQIELYSHLSVFKTFVDYLKRDGWQICVVSASGGVAAAYGSAGCSGRRECITGACMSACDSCRPCCCSVSFHCTSSADLLPGLSVHLGDAQVHRRHAAGGGRQSWTRRAWAMDAAWTPSLRKPESTRTKQLCRAAGMHLSLAHSLTCRFRRPHCRRR